MTVAPDIRIGVTNARGVSVIQRLDAGTPPAPGGSSMAMGDSITANGVNAGTGLFNTKNYLLWSVLQSRGQMIYGGVAGTSGWRTDQINATHLPTILAARPGSCVVLMGINNVFQKGGVDSLGRTISIATTVADLTAAYSALKAAGIMPILCTLTPVASTSGTDAVRKDIATLNNWIKRYGAAHGFPVADLYAACVNTTNGDWQSVGDNFDDTHPAGPGAKKMGKAIADAITGYLVPLPLPLVQSNLPAARQASQLPNGLLLTDTNADGTPDNWTKSVSGTGSGSLKSAAADGVPGNWFAMNHPATDAVEWKSDGCQPMAAGDRVGFGCWVKYDPTGVGARFHLRLINAATGALIAAGGFENFDIAIPLSALWLEAVVPAGVTGLQASATFDTAAATAQIAQPTVVNLTNLGIEV